MQKLLSLFAAPADPAGPHQHHRTQSTDLAQQQQQRSRPPLQRRRSEGSDTGPPRSSSRTSHHQQHKHQHHQHRQRRVSFDGSASSLENAGTEQRVVRCRNSKCPNSATLTEARRSYKSCHNCTCLYCSRECRKAHWQRHRRVCLYSRASNLCIQVLSSVKKDPTTLKHVSILARRGFATHGRGAVKCFFASPEAAEKFVQVGFLELGEPSYVRWSDILPSEMGAELYAEAVRLCESYNPESRLVVYVSVCVVREVPSSSAGAVMWERQPVSRCAKLKLEASCRLPSAGNNNCVSSSLSCQLSAPVPAPPSEPCNITREMESPETLVMTSNPPPEGGSTPRSVRELGFGNIQRELKQRGVSLRRHFPGVYGKLSAYVEGTVDNVAPMTIYPRDQASGRSFMCIIMLNAEPERLQLLPTDSSRVKLIDVETE